MAYICPFLSKIWKFLKIHRAILGQIYYFLFAQWSRFIFNVKNNHPCRKIIHSKIIQQSWTLCGQSQYNILFYLICKTLYLEESVNFHFWFTKYSLWKCVWNSDKPKCWVVASNYILSLEMFSENWTTFVSMVHT